MTAKNFVACFFYLIYTVFCLFYTIYTLKFYCEHILKKIYTHRLFIWSIYVDFMKYMDNMGDNLGYMHEQMIFY